MRTHIVWLCALMTLTAVAAAVEVPLTVTNRAEVDRADADGHTEGDGRPARAQRGR